MLKLKYKNIEEGSECHFGPNESASASFVLNHFYGEPQVGERICKHCYESNRDDTFALTFIQELEKRGYDIETMEFSIKKKGEKCQKKKS